MTAQTKDRRSISTVWNHMTGISRCSKPSCCYKCGV